MGFDLGGLLFGFSICYDLRFPEMYRKLAVEQKVGAFLISSAWPFPRDEHFRILAVARAIENQSYVIASNRVGKDDDLWFCGGSAIIDPRGVVIAAASADREELIQADLSEEIVRSVRQRVKSLAHRRPDLWLRRLPRSVPLESFRGGFPRSGLRHGSGNRDAVARLSGA